MSDVTPGVATKDLRPGKKYKIDIEDCCVNAQLQGTFLEFRDGGSRVTLVFDIGTFEMFDECVFEEVKE